MLFLGEKRGLYKSLFLIEDSTEEEWMAIKIKRKYSGRQRPAELINTWIKFPRVMVIGDDKKPIGEMSTSDALQMAQDQDLDLICINKGFGDKLPITVIQDYGKFKYNKSKKEKETKRNQSVVENKEIRLTVNIGQHDMETKARHAIEFFKDGNRVKVSLKYKGREMQHKEIGRETIMKFYDLVKDYSSIDKQPKIESRFLNMFLAPKKNQGSTNSKPETNKPKVEAAKPKVEAAKAVKPKAEAAKPKVEAAKPKVETAKKPTATKPKIANK